MHGALAMKLGLVAVGLTLLLSSVAAIAVEPCENQKSEVAEKLDGKGVKNYSLNVVPTD
jgi:Protein of unknown function (DUF1161)